MDALTYTSSLLKMLAALCIVLALMIGFHWLVKALRRRSSFLNGNEEMLRVVVSKPLNHKNSLLLVDVLGELFLVGLSGGQMTCMSPLSDPAAKEKIRALPENPAHVPSLFGQFLKERLHFPGATAAREKEVPRERPQ